MNSYNKIFVILLACLLLISGCSALKTQKKSKWRPVSQKKKVIVHEVKSHKETFEMIAKWYTGKQKNAEKLLDANPALNPEKLNTGDNVYIPGYLLRTRKEMDQKFVETFLRKMKVVKKKIKKKKVVRPAKTEKKSETDDNAFELFGPR